MIDAFTVGKTPNGYDEIEGMKVLMVCMGNICRSPMAEGVFRGKLEKLGLSRQVSVDSAGISRYHAGEAPDPRARKVAARRGYPLDGIKARALQVADFQRFDLLLAMDRDNLRNLERQCPPEAQDRLGLFLSFAPQLGIDEVPDPYYGGEAGFERVFGMVEAASDGLIEHVRARLAAG